VSLSAGWIESLSPQGLKISAYRAFGRIGLSKFIAERGRSACFFNLYWRAARKHVAVIFLTATISSSVMASSKRIKGRRVKGFGRAVESQFKEPLLKSSLWNPMTHLGTPGSYKATS